MLCDIYIKKYVCIASVNIVGILVNCWFISIILYFEVNVFFVTFVLICFIKVKNDYNVMYLLFM